MKKEKISLKKRTLNNIMPLLAVAVILVGFCMASMKVYALGTGGWAGVPDLGVKGSAAYGLARDSGDEAAMRYIKECNTLHPGAISAEAIETILDSGYLTGYVDELKSLGYISAGYTLSGSSSEQVQPISEPESFTVEDMEDTPMWAIQIVNYRDGASTDYNKLGSLAQYEQVIVNGVASTGWYRFITEDGSTAYVSNSYLTTEDPSNRELNIYNEETGQVDTYVFENTEPEAIDEVIESIKEEYEEKETVVEEPEPEPEPEEVVAVEEEPEIIDVMVEEESPAYSWKFYVSCAFIVMCGIIIGICIRNIVRNKKNGRVD